MRCGGERRNVDLRAAVSPWRGRKGARVRSLRRYEYLVIASGTEPAEKTWPEPGKPPLTRRWLKRVVFLEGLSVIRESQHSVFRLTGCGTSEKDRK